MVFSVLKKAKDNPNVNWTKKMGILWRPELVHLQELNEMPAYKQKSKLFVIEKILEKVPKEILQYQVTNELFERDYTTIAEQINEYRIKNGQKKRRKRKRRKNTMK